MDFEKPHNWSDLLSACTSAEEYKCIVDEMLSDGVIHEGRLRVLEIYTIEVCHLCKQDEERNIRKYFNELKIKYINSKKQGFWSFLFTLLWSYV